MDGNLCLVCEAVLLGHAEGRALTATEIANYLDMPRPSVHRRLDRLIELEMIVRTGDQYYLEPDRAKNVPHLKRFVEISERAFAVLGPYLASKMDTGKKI
jgi:DNA-binding IclR family transcriptional regulator